MTDYTGRGGYYEHEAERQEEVIRKQREAKEARPEWKEWDTWRTSFLATSLNGLTVGELLRGMKKLENEPK